MHYGLPPATMVGMVDWDGLMTVVNSSVPKSPRL
jgi:hypothetical protein